jgi:predicted ATPase
MNTFEGLPHSKFAFTTDAVKFMQDTYKELEQLTRIAGDNCILTGCEAKNGIISSGYAILNGEILKYNGGNYSGNTDNLYMHRSAESAHIIVGENAGYRDQNTLKLTINTTPGSYKFIDAVRIEYSTIKQIRDRLNRAEPDITTLKARAQEVWNFACTLEDKDYEHDLAIKDLQNKDKSHDAAIIALQNKKINLATDVTGVLPMTNGGTSRNLKLDWDIRVQMNETASMNTASVHSAIVLGGTPGTPQIVYICIYIYGISSNFGPFHFDLPLPISHPYGPIPSGWKIPFDIYARNFSGTGDIKTASAYISEDNKLHIRANEQAGYFPSPCLVYVRGMYLTKS